ncbi:MAG: ATPase, partial [Myxococcota bacterium]
VDTPVSTRGLLLYAQAARARALVFGRPFVSPEDVHALAVPVCAHRLVVKGQERPSRGEVESLVESLLDRTPAPS